MEYIKARKIVKISDIKKKIYTLQSKEHFEFNINNSNLIKIKELINYENVGSQINVKSYLDKDCNYYLGTISSMGGLIFNIEKCEYITEDAFLNSSKKLNKGDIIISRNASLGKLSILNEDINIILNGGLSYIRVYSLIKKYYLISFFISNYGKKYLEYITAGGGTQKNAKRENVLDIKIPFPTQQNNPNPKQVEQLVSLMVQNIINKEEQISVKNKKIDNLIEKELMDNQKDNIFVYRLPKISEIKGNNTRLDSGLYKKDTKKLLSIIENYKGGYTVIKKEDLQGGSTPKDRYFGTGQLWLSPTNCKKGVLTKKILIKSKQYNIKETSIIISNRSNICETILCKIYKNNVAQHNQGMYRMNISQNFIYGIFILCIFNFSIYQKYVNKIATGSTFKEIRMEEIEKCCLIPLFPKTKQVEIAQNYYNELPKNNILDFNNYLDKEKQRNSELGIYQLNMELFDLKEKINGIVDKIIMNKYVDIDFKY